MLILKRKKGEAISLFDSATGKHLGDLVYAGRTGPDEIIVEFCHGDETTAYVRRKGDVISIEDQVGKDLLVVQFADRQKDGNRIAFAIFGAKGRITVLRRELVTPEGYAKAKEKRGLNENEFTKAS